MPEMRMVGTTMTCAALEGVWSTGKASIETLGDVDFGARKCHANASVGWQTDVVDDDPQGVSVGLPGQNAADP